MVASVPQHRILILGGGFAGVATARRLETLLRYRPDVEIVLVSAENFVLMTPLLFEVFSGTLDVQDCSLPIRAFLHRTRFIEATVSGIDLDRRVVCLAGAGQRRELKYDQLVLALGSKTNRQMIPGSEHAFTFKSLADALVLRNYVIERFERADVEPDPRRKAQLLTFVIIRGGLVGVELLGELTTFVDGIAYLYRNIDRHEVRFVLLQGGDRIMPEIDPTLAAYGLRVLAQRPGVETRTNAKVRAIEPGKVHLTHETYSADTIVLAAGAVPSPVIACLPIEKSPRGHIVVEPTMRCPSHPEVWAIGDCASIPGPDGTPYPTLAQHALREAQVLACNIFGALIGRPPQPFVYCTLGIMGSLGQGKGFGRLLKVRVYGLPAWFIRRTYYMLQMPGWSRRLRILIDWTLALLVRPEVVNVDLDSETALMLRELALRDGATMHIEAMSHSPRRGSRDPALGPDTEAENSAAYLVDR
jgi:NADH dehydrogenase